MRVLLAVVTLCMTAALIAQRPASQAPVAQLVIVRAQVLSAGEPGSPLRRTRVAVSQDGRQFPPVYADDQGRFEMRVRPSTAYTVSLSKAGFIPLSLPLRAPASAGSLEVRLVPGAAISGRVVDGAGHPVVSVGVVARPAAEPGQEPSSSLFYAETDDLGDYRISSLPPGRYDVYSVRSMGALGILDVNPRLLDQGNPIFQRDDTGLRLRNELLVRNKPMSERASVDVQPGSEAALVIAFAEPATIAPYAAVGGVITGLVRDSSGEPVEGMAVQVWQTIFAGGRMIAQRTGMWRITDDRGRYRLFHLPAGKYLVRVEQDPSRRAPAGSTPQVPVYYPGRTSVSDAVPLYVGRSEEIANADIVFAESGGSRVFGTVVNASGDPLAGAPVSLSVSYRSGAVTPPFQTIYAAGDGRFEFPAVPPGEYTIRVSGNALVAQMAGPGSPRPLDSSAGFGLRYVTVAGADVGPVLLRARPTVDVRGRFVVEGAQPVSMSEFRVTAVPADPDFDRSLRANALPLGAVTPEGTFEIRGLAGPSRIVVTTTAPGWWARSVTAGALDASDQPVDFAAGPRADGLTVVVTNTAATLSGRVLDERSQPVDEYWIVVFPVDQNRWFFKSPYVLNTYARPDGRFVLGSIPPGDYYVAAVDVIEGDSVTGDWQNPALMTRLMPQARRLALSEGERAMAELRLVRQQP